MMGAEGTDEYVYQPEATSVSTHLHIYHRLPPLGCAVWVRAYASSVLCMQIEHPYRAVPPS